MNEKAKVIRATITLDYYIEMIDDERTSINGWTIDQVIEDWFKNKKHPMGTYHATRDGHRIGYSEKFIKMDIISLTQNKFKRKIQMQRNRDKCDRCGCKTTVTSMSRFNTEMCCMGCIHIEKQHPAYKGAADAEMAAINMGNYNFRGAGLPEGYSEWIKKGVQYENK